MKLIIVPLLVIASILLGCGGQYKVKGSTTHHVVTSGETKVTVSLDVSACQGFTTEAAQTKCLDMLIEMMATLNELKDLEDSTTP